MNLDNTQMVEQIISAISVGQIVILNTLHSQGVIDKRHFAHAFARAIDTINPNPNNRLLVAILQVTKNALLQTGQADQPNVQEWIGKLLAADFPSGGQEKP